MDTLSEELARRAATDPGALAVLQGNRQLSYREFDAAATEFAQRLRATGVAPHTPVAVLLPRGPDLAVAVVGTMRNGNVYVPLDPAVPQGRLEAMAQAA